MSHSNNLSKAQEERLHHLIEECSEVIKEACKILHHGYDSWNPDDKVGYPNRNRLQDEAEQLLSIMNKMGDVGDIDFNIPNLIPILPQIWNKKKKYCKYQD